MYLSDIIHRSFLRQDGGVSLGRTLRRLRQLRNLRLWDDLDYSDITTLCIDTSSFPHQILFILSYTNPALSVSLCLCRLGLSCQPGGRGRGGMKIIVHDISVKRNIFCTHFPHFFPSDFVPFGGTWGQYIITILRTQYGYSTGTEIIRQLTESMTIRSSAGLGSHGFQHSSVQ